MQVRDEARVVARLTAAYAQEGRGRKADADRAATELARRETDFQAAEGDVLIASARLAEVINVDPSIRLHPTDAWVVPHPIVPDPIPVCRADRAGPAPAPRAGRAPGGDPGGPAHARRCQAAAVLADATCSASVPAASAAAATWSARSSAGSAAGPTPTSSSTGPHRTSASATWP